MKIEPGYWKTRDGRKARILCTDAPGEQSLLGYLCIDEKQYSSTTWWPDGSYFGGNPESGVDLVEPWREPVKYRVDVWLVEHPSPGALTSLCRFIFGRGAGDISWSEDKYGACDKHYRITVEEMQE